MSSEQALKAQISYMEKWPKYPRSRCLLHCLPSLSLYLWSHGEFPRISWQKKRRLGLVLQMVLHHLKADSCSAIASLREGKHFPWAEFQAVYLVVHFAWEEKWPNIIYDHIPINGLWPMVWLDDQGLRKNTNGNLVIKKSGEEVCRQTSLSERKTCRYLCLVNAH